MRRVGSLVVLVVLGCSNTFVSTQDVVSPDREDALADLPEARDDVGDDGATADLVDDPRDEATDARLDASEEPRDVSLDAAEAEADRPDGSPDATPIDADVRDAPEVETTADVVSEEVAAPTDADCPRDPPAGPPPEVGRSCGAGRAPAEHCREVAFCGGTYRMGSAEAWEVTCRAVSGGNLQMRSCDVHEAVARGGYVDAYEVTVARYRAWVNAGFPHPNTTERYFNGLQWFSSFNRDMVVPDRATIDDSVAGARTTDAMCTWSATPGVRDDLPINCVPQMAAIAFCWWEGKHLATEITWEYLATNRGTTPTPFGAIPPPDAMCSRGDVGGYTGQCPRQPYPMRIGTHPDGVTRDPAGIHDLWGGVQEQVLGLASPYAPYDRGVPFCTRDAPRSVDGRFEVSGGLLVSGDVMQRGPSWLQDPIEFSYFYHAATREGRTDMSTPLGRNPTSVRVGFRCARWLPEPR